MRRKFIAALTVFISLLTIGFGSARTIAQPRSSAYISVYSSAVVKSGSNIVVNYSVTGTGKMAYIGASSIKLYEKSGSSAWVLAIEFTYPTTASLQSTNSVSHSKTSPSYTGTSGRQYYAVVVFYAANSSGSDSKSYTTSTITF